MQSEEIMKVKKCLMVFPIVFSLIACSQNLNIPTDAAVMPTFTPWVAGTETALANPNLPAGTQTAQAVINQNVLPTFPPPTDNPGVVMAKPTDFSPVLFGKKYDTTVFLLLGGVGRGVWFTPDVSALRFADEAAYSLHTLTQEYSYFFRGRAPESSPTCDSFFVGTDADLDEVGMIAVLDGWDITKRDVTELPANNQFYQQVVIDWLTAEGVSSPEIGSLQVFRVDLEGDGADEIFISATRLDGSQHTTKAGDYSVVLMRKVVGNDAVTIPLVADVYSSRELEITFPLTYSLVNFIDLNQDGVLEVVVDIQKWEGFGAIVFQIDGQDVIQSLRAEC